MNPQPSQQTSPKATLNVIWLALTSAIASYWFIRMTVKVSAQPNAGTALLAYLLLALAAGVYGAAWWLFQRMISDISREADPLRLQQMNQEQRSALAQRLQNGTITCLGMLEAPAVCGLISVFLGSPIPGMFEGLALTTLAVFVVMRVKGYPVIFQWLDQLAAPSA